MSDLAERLEERARNRANKHLPAENTIEWEAAAHIRDLEAKVPPAVDNWYSKPIQYLSTGDLIDALSWSVERMREDAERAKNAEAKTIERAAQEVADVQFGWLGADGVKALAEAEKRIRALKPSE